MKCFNGFSSLILVALTGLLCCTCQQKERESFVVKHSYDYTIKISTANLGGGATFELRPARMKLNKFHNQLKEAEPIMYAYCTVNGYKEGEPIDVVKEKAVSKQQADRLFELAKAIFTSTQVSDIDTVYQKQDKQIIYAEDTYSYGQMSIITHYSNVQLNIGVLKPDNSQTVPFNELYKEFVRVFE